MDPLGFSQAVKDYQASLPSLGISYGGPIDGIVNPLFASSMLALEMKLEISTGIPAVGNIFSGGQIILPLNKMKEIYLKTDKKETPEPVKTKTLKDDELIRQWQQYLSKSLPIVGRLYQGDVDGIINPQLISAVQQLEGKVSSRLKNSSIVGKVWNNRFLTDPSDMDEGLRILQSST